MRLITIIILSSILGGCISLGTDADLTRIAREEWTKMGPPKKYLRMPINGQVCIGFPGCLGSSNGVSMFVPWPWSECEVMTRAIMRYELSKVAIQLHGVEMGLPCGPLLWLDAFAHGPISELHSWYRVFFPSEGKYNETSRLATD